MHSGRCPGGAGMVAACSRAPELQRWHLDRILGTGLVTRDTSTAAGEVLQHPLTGNIILLLLSKRRGGSPSLASLTQAQALPGLPDLNPLPDNRDKAGRGWGSPTLESPAPAQQHALLSGPPVLAIVSYSPGSPVRGSAQQCHSMPRLPPGPVSAGPSTVTPGPRAGPRPPAARACVCPPAGCP